MLVLKSLYLHHTDPDFESNLVYQILWSKVCDSSKNFIPLDHQTTKRDEQSYSSVRSSSSFAGNCLIPNIVYQITLNYVTLR